MKVFAAALPFLILAAALGPLALGSPDHGAQGGGSLSLNHGVQPPTDCCPSYTPQNIQCVFMEDYYETSSRCPLLAVIFITKSGQQVCADPRNRMVHRCMEDLDSAKKQRKTAG